MSGIYEVTLRGVMNGQSTINVFHYVDAGSLDTPNALSLLTLMGFIPSGDPAEYPDDTVFADIRACVSLNVGFLEVQARELYSTTDFYTAAFSPSVPGLQDQPASSPFLAWGLFSNRIRTDVGRGFKRLPGVTEANMDSGGAVGAGQMDVLVTLAAKMSEVLNYLSVEHYYPSVLAFEKYTTDSGRTAYRPYPTRDEQLAHAAVGVTWAAYDTVRSQTSRQYGRGV